MKTDNAQLINQTTGNVEYMSPPFIIDGVRFVMRDIMLDVASSPKFNKKIKAKRYFSKSRSALTIKRWEAPTIWMNHPFSKGVNNLWVQKFIEARARIKICITYAATSEKWFQPLMNYPQCFLCPRTNYYDIHGKIKQGVTKGSVVTIITKNSKALDRFNKYFSKYGKIK